MDLIQQLPTPSGEPQLPKIPAMGGDSEEQNRELWAIIALLMVIVTVVALLHQFGIIDLNQWIPEIFQ